MKRQKLAKLSLLETYCSAVSRTDTFIASSHTGIQQGAEQLRQVEDLFCLYSRENKKQAPQGIAHVVPSILHTFPHIYQSLPCKGHQQ